MPWLITALISWVFLFLALKGNKIRGLWTAGLWSLAVLLIVSMMAVDLGLLSFQEKMYHFGDVPLFFLVAVMAAGMLIIRFLPENKAWQLVYIIIISMVLTTVEFFFSETGLLVYHNWLVGYSFIVYILLIIVIVWLSELTVQRRRGYLFK